MIKTLIQGFSLKNQDNQRLMHEIASKYTNIKVITTNKSNGLLYSNKSMNDFLFGVHELLTSLKTWGTAPTYHEPLSI